MSAVPPSLFADRKHFTIMQTTSLLVALRGDVNNTVSKHGMTVPETLVLMAAHGAHSVTVIPGTIENISRAIPPHEEVARLSRCYGEEPTEACFGKPKFGMRLPANFSEVGIEVEEPDDDEDEDEETHEERKARLAAAKVAKAAAKAHRKLLEAAKAPPAPVGGGVGTTGIGESFVGPASEDETKQSEDDNLHHEED